MTCRVYGWRIDYVLYELPIVQMAMLYRCSSQSRGSNEGTTLLEKMLAEAQIERLKNG